MVATKGVGRQPEKAHERAWYGHQRVSLRFGNNHSSDLISNIRGAGYDVFLVLEATIGFNKREEEEEDDAHQSALQPSQVPPAVYLQIKVPLER